MVGEKDDQKINKRIKSLASDMCRSCVCAMKKDIDICHSNEALEPRRYQLSMYQQIERVEIGSKKGELLDRNLRTQTNT